VASVAGTVLAVCSCTVLPLFAGIYRMGAGLGPACAFLYAGPAINVLAIALTARILGLEMGIARAVGAIVFSVVIGLIMHVFFAGEEAERAAQQPQTTDGDTERPLWQSGLYFGSMVGVLVFANWGRPEAAVGFWHAVWSARWLLTAASGLLLGVVLTLWYGVPSWGLPAVALPVALAAVHFADTPLVAFALGTVGLSVLLAMRNTASAAWLEQSWGFARQILPLLLIGVLIAGALLGRPGHEGLIPSGWVSRAVGGNSPAANLFASVAGALMYFATLTEVPIIQGLLGAGMGKGPALALLLAGPALSLPNMLVIRSVMGTRKTVVYVALVVAMATMGGTVYGTFF
jgi:uncharacterized membrane protein YraQ (UPF0718 family)